MNKNVTPPDKDPMGSSPFLPALTQSAPSEEVRHNINKEEHPFEAKVADKVVEIRTSKKFAKKTPFDHVLIAVSVVLILIVGCTCMMTFIPQTLLGYAAPAYQDINSDGDKLSISNADIKDTLFSTINNKYDITYKTVETWGLTDIDDFGSVVTDYCPEPTLTYTEYEDGAGKIRVGVTATEPVFNDARGSYAKTLDNRMVNDCKLSERLVDSDKVYIMRTIILAGTNVSYTDTVKYVIGGKQLLEIPTDPLHGTYTCYIEVPNVRAYAVKHWVDPFNESYITTILWDTMGFDPTYVTSKLFAFVAYNILVGFLIWGLIKILIYYMRDYAILLMGLIVFGKQSLSKEVSIGGLSKMLEDNKKKKAGQKDFAPPAPTSAPNPQRQAPPNVTNLFINNAPRPQQKPSNSVYVNPPKASNATAANSVIDANSIEEIPSKPMTSAETIIKQSTTKQSPKAQQVVNNTLTPSAEEERAIVNKINDHDKLNFDD